MDYSVRIISIHAPARGATDDKPRDFTEAVISIHAPARGATNGLAQDANLGIISIHAPARGATDRTAQCSRDFRHFYPRTRKGCDGDSPHIFVTGSLFLSTHPQGVRRAVISSVQPFQHISIHAPARGATYAVNSNRHTAIDFYPRTRKGCDCDCASSNAKAMISIHAPARGATQVSAEKLRFFLISIHAPARGATVAIGLVSRKQFISIHAPARGATNRTQILQQYLDISIHAPARGATRKILP